MTYDARNPDREPWLYACQRCGAPYKDKLEFCRECDEATIVPITQIARE